MIRNILNKSLAGVLSLTAVGAFAQTQHEVAFIGDAITQQWAQQPQFTAHTNWENDATPLLQTVASCSSLPTFSTPMGQPTS